VSTNQPHSHDLPLDLSFDFLNTRELESGAPVDHFRTADDAFDWLAHHGVIHDELLDLERRRARTVPGAGDRALARIRRVRDAMREVTDAIVERRAAASAAVTEVNRALRAREVIQLEPAVDGVEVGHRHVGDAIDDGLARLVEPVVREISAGQPQRLRICANDTCRWAFFDDSPTGRRRWCDMATCGNRAKAARHRARRKAAAAGDARPA
jgi:predicted RNA-binding Zn ribbon-like protein